MGRGSAQCKQCTNEGIMNSHDGAAIAPAFTRETFVVRLVG